jgi:outer membrane protein OmpA-like peptidoglycan-associated protein
MKAPGTRRLALILPLCLLLAGCAASGPPVGSLLADFQRFELEAQAKDPGPVAAAFLESGQAQRERARALRDKGKGAQAGLLLTRALADARVALAVTEMDGSALEAELCLRAAEKNREAWDEALRLLVQAEQSAHTVAEGVPHQVPGLSDLTDSTLPESGLAVEEVGSGPAAPLEAGWNRWAELAEKERVPTADLELLFRRALTEADREKKAERRALGQYCAARVVQELEARVRTDNSHRTCARAALLATELGLARDTALRATLLLQQGLQDSLRVQLERTQAEARDRQSELRDALHQIEGKFARIHQEARGTIVSLADILFDFDKATLKRNVEFNLVRVATILNQFPEMSIAVEGHTDNVGKPEYNLDLSKRRAQAVFEFLVTQEVSAERMTVEGYGMTRPVDDNGTEAGRQKNRRVDLVIQSRTAETPGSPPRREIDSEIPSSRESQGR